MNVLDNLSQRLGSIFKKLRGQGRLTEANMKDGLREIRLALLEADVHFKVARDLLGKVQEQALGQDVLGSLTPAQQVVKIVHSELTALLGGQHQPLRLSSRPPTVVLMVGLQGSGKTTTAAKLACLMKKGGRSPLLVPADLARPAAVEQLARLGEAAGVNVFATDLRQGPLQAVQGGMSEARSKGHDLVLIDTAGRLHIDEDLMAELVGLQKASEASEVLYVADAMTGQDAVTSAARFHATIGLTGIVLSKLDGDARGGAALSVRAVTGVPLRYVGVGEKLDDLEPFHPERMSSRILGMGDVLTLVEKAQSIADVDDDRRLAERLRKATFTLEDFRDQLRKVRQLGPLDQILQLIPGMGQIPTPEMDGGEIGRTEAIINSMTPGERRDHTLINGSRRKRIARGSGTRVNDVNRLLKQFAALHKLMKKTGGRMDPRALKNLRF